MREADREGDCSAFGVAFWYVRNVVTWWRFPYWVAEWDHGYSMKAMPASIEQWSQPLPPEQWAKPSAALTEQTARIKNPTPRARALWITSRVNWTKQLSWRWAQAERWGVPRRPG
jgi:hypothetical protein